MVERKIKQRGAATVSLRASPEDVVRIKISAHDNNTTAALAHSNEIACDPQILSYGVYYARQYEIERASSRRSVQSIPHGDSSETLGAR